MQSATCGHYYGCQMRIAVIGSSGQLGFDLARLLPPGGHTVLPFSGRAELDITDSLAVLAMLDQLQPEAVINTAAFHNVDLCEKEPESAYRTNVLAVREMARACERRKILFVQIGTDYVMEGYPANQPLPETAAVHPVSIYAVTRFGGDAMTLTHAPTCGYVVRSCGLFGVAGCKLKGGLNFVDTMIVAARAGKPLRVVNDQIVAPTATVPLAEHLRIMLEQRVPAGLYHAVSHGQCSWFDMAVAALKFAGIAHPIEPVPSTVYAAPAQRPRYSVLDNARLRTLGLDTMPTWHTALEQYVHEKYC